MVGEAAGKETVEEAQKLRVFLSYSRKDGEFLARLAEALTGLGYDASYDASPHGRNNPDLAISAEDEWWKQLEAMIAKAEVMVFVVSPDSAGSKVCDEEIAYARRLGKRVIAILRREIDFAKAPPKLAALNVKLRFTDDSEAGFAASLAELKQALDLDAGWWREQKWFAVQLKDWLDADEKQKAGWLLSEAETERADRWAARRPPGAAKISEAEHEYLVASRENVALQARRRRRMQATVFALTIVALVITIAGGIYVINRQRDVARSESLMLANAAAGQASSGSQSSALRLSLLAARDTFLSPAAPEAEPSLIRDSAQWTLAREFRGPPGSSFDVAMSADGTRVAAWDLDGSSARLWDSATGRVLVEFKAPPDEDGSKGDQISGATFVGEGAQFVLWMAGGGVYAWDAANGTELWRKELGSVSSEVLVSADGRFMATIVYRLDDSEEIDAQTPTWIVIIDLATGKLVLERNDPDISDLQFADGGSLLAVGDAYGRVRIYDATTGRQRAFFDMDFGYRILPSGPFEPTPYDRTRPSPQELRVSEDGQWLAGWTAEGAVAVWSIATGQLKFVTQPHTSYDEQEGVERSAEEEYEDIGEILRAEFTAGGSRFTTYNSEEVFRIRNSDDGADAAVLRLGDNGDVSSEVFISDDGGMLATSTFGIGSLKIMRTDEPDRPLRTLPVGVDMADARFSSDGSRVLVREPSGEMRLWDVLSGRLLARMSHDGRTFGMDLLPDGGVLSWADDGSVRIWRQPPIQPLRLDGEVFYGEAAFYAGSSKAMLRFADGSYAQIDGKTGAVEARQFYPGHTCEDVTFYQKCSIAVLDDAGRFAVWGPWGMGTTSADETGIRLLHPPGQSIEVIMSPDGTTAFVDEADGAALWNVSSGQKIADVAEGISVRMAAFISGGKELVTWGFLDARFLPREPGQESVVVTPDWKTRPAQIWSVADGKLLRTTPPIAGELFRETGVSPDGRWLFGPPENGVAKLFDLSTGKEAATAELPDQEGRAAFSPRVGELVTYGSQDGATLRKIETGDKVRIVRLRSFPTSGEIFHQGFSPDGRFFAAGDGVENAVIVWSTDTGQRVMTAHLDSNVTDRGISFNQSGSRLFLSDEAGSVSIWDTSTGAVLFSAAAEGPAGIGSALVVSPDEQRMISMRSSGGMQLFDISGTVKPRSVAELREQVCKSAMTGEEVADVAGVMSGVRRISPADVAAVPILRGREGEDVCGWRPQWYDSVFDLLFGWIR